MKGLITIVALVVGLGAYAQTEVHKGEVVSRSNTHQAYETKVFKNNEGVVKMGASEDCSLYILTEVEGKEMHLMPLNLEERLQVEGQKISFSYAPAANVKVNRACGLHMAVTLSDVEAKVEKAKKKESKTVPTKTKFKTSEQ